MVSIFQGLYKEKYNRCRQNYKLVDVEYKGRLLRLRRRLEELLSLTEYLAQLRQLQSET